MKISISFNQQILDGANAVWAIVRSHLSVGESAEGLCLGDLKCVRQWGKGFLKCLMKA